MLDPDNLSLLTESVRNAVMADQKDFNILMNAVMPLKRTTKRIQPRRSTAISIVATDGNNNGVAFDPFIVDVIRVVDSSNHQYCLEAVTPNTPVDVINSRHFDAQGTPRSPLGRMLDALGVCSIHDLSSSITKDPTKRAGLWVTIYRELSEWAVLLDLIRGDHIFGTDTIIVFDSLLRSKKFANGLFAKYQILLDEAIRSQYKEHHRRIYVVGIARRNKFMQRYRLAMAIQGIMGNAFPCYTSVPDDLQKTAYKWSEIVTGGGEGEGFSAGKLYLVKFGAHSHDPVWAVDILKSQAGHAGLILGHLLFDAQEGFPIPYYPMSLQQAHERADLSGLDRDILQDKVVDTIRECIDSNEELMLDELALQSTGPLMTNY